MLKLVSTSTGNLFISPKPDEWDLQYLNCKYDIIWNMTDEVDYAEFEKQFAHDVLVGNVEDYNIPKDINLFDYQLDMVVNCLRLNGLVLIHCLAGHGRTGMALASVLSRLEKISIKKAINKTRCICEGPETAKQIYFLLKFFGE